MTTEQMRDYISNRYSSDSNFNLIQFDPSKAPNTISGSYSHVVVPVEDLKDSNGNVIGFKVFDPQKKLTYEIPLSSVIDILGIRSDGSYSNSGSNSGGSSYSGSDSHGSNTSSGSSGVGVGSEGCYTPSGY